MLRRAWRLIDLLSCHFIARPVFLDVFLRNSDGYLAASFVQQSTLSESVAETRRVNAREVFWV